MDFNNLPDPDKIMQGMKRIGEALQDAADNSTGQAQPLFQSLSDTFNKVAAQDPSRLADNPMAMIMSLLPAMAKLKGDMEKLRILAQQDPAVQETLLTLAKAIKEETQGMFGGMLGDGGPFSSGSQGADGGFDDDMDDEPFTPPTPPVKKPPTPPKKNDKGDFDI